MFDPSYRKDSLPGKHSLKSRPVDHAKPRSSPICICLSNILFLFSPVCYCPDISLFLSTRLDRHTAAGVGKRGPSKAPTYSTAHHAHFPPPPSARRHAYIPGTELEERHLLPSDRWRTTPSTSCRCGTTRSRAPEDGSTTPR
jgi:hypothetical protein